MKICTLVVAAFTCLTASLHAAPIVYKGVLSASNEVPTNPSLGTGTARVVFDIEAHSLSVDVVFSNLTGLTTASHIHCCIAPGANTIVATELPSFSNLPLGVTSGSFTQTYNTSLVATYNPAFVTANGGTAAGAEAALAAGLAAGNAYVNLHTAFRAGGEIRANLAQIPEPGTWGMMGAALVAVVALRRKLAR